MLFDDPLMRDFPDRGLRLALENAKNLRDAVTAARPDLAPLLDFDHVEYLRPQFLLEDWRGREADVLCRVPYRDPSGLVETVLICLLVEHQSKPDARMPLRLLLYAVLFWEQQWKEYEAQHARGEGLRLTPVVPIVLHTGQGTWNSNRTLGELFAGPEALRAFAPTWPVTFWDLAAQTTEGLLATDGPFTQFLAVVRAEQSERDEFRKVLVECAEKLEAVHGRDTMRWKDLLQLLVSWVIQRRPQAERDEMTAAVTASQREVLSREEAKTVSEAVQETWIQWALREATVKAKKELREQVEKEVEQKTRLETLRKMLVGLLARSGESLPADLAAAIQSCEDDAKLEAAILKVGTQPSSGEFQL